MGAQSTMAPFRMHQLAVKDTTDQKGGAAP